MCGMKESCCGVYDEIDLDGLYNCKTEPVLTVIDGTMIFV